MKSKQDAFERLPFIAALLCVGWTAFSDASANEYFCAGGDVQCLVEAIQAANANGEPDEITLEQGVYTLTEVEESDQFGPSGLPYVRSELLIRGSGSVIERDPSSPPFRILTAWQGGGSLTIEGLTIRGGQAAGTDYDGWGGGIFNLNGPLTIRDSFILENSAVEAGGIYNEDGDFLVERSTIQGNTSDSDGGIWNWCFNGQGGWAREWFVIDSTIDMNVGSGAGGLSSDCIAVLVNSTISRNTGSTGGVRSFGMRAINSTIAGNTGVFVGGFESVRIDIGLPYIPEFILHNTILANNEGNLANDCVDSSVDPSQVPYEIVSLGHNVIGDTTRCEFSLQPTDIVGDPGLGVFIDSGEPGQGHYPPLKGGPVVDAGDDSACSPLDQIGNPRYDGDADGMVVCDIGAIEYQGELSEVAIDFKPGNRRNVINPRSRGRFWVATLSTDDFDALQIDPASVAFGPGAASPDRYKVKNVNADRNPDLMLRFRTPEVGLQCGDTEVELTGETYAGGNIIGSDAVKTVGCKNPKKGKKK